ncbi:MAG: hypothetical protein IKP69_03880 [Oscillospiraceae bacterium]|nr:hypothetical protein [Oscillospiraceae bacterium]
MQFCLLLQRLLTFCLLLPQLEETFILCTILITPVKILDVPSVVPTIGVSIYTLHNSDYSCKGS